VAPGKASALAHLIASQQVDKALASGGPAKAAILQAGSLASIDALNEILLVATVVAFTGAVLGLLLVRSSDFAHGTEPSAEPAAAAA
jgi:hypothetical protein